MKLLFFILCVAISTSSCSQTVIPLVQPTAPQSAPIDLSKVHNDTLYKCKYKLDNSELDYLKSERVDTISTLFKGYTISDITDIHGRRWTVNPAEWSNFICTTKFIP